MDDSTLPALADMLPAPADLAEIIAAAHQHGQLPAEAIFHPGTGERLDREPWAGVTNDDVAEWAMAKLAAVTARVDAMKAHADHLMAQIDSWFHGEMEKRQGDWPSLRDQQVFFASHLEAYARAERDEKGRKTIPLVSGDVATRSNPARLVIEDEDALIGWALENAPDLIVTVSKIPAARLKQSIVVTDAGEVVLHDFDPDEFQRPDEILPGLPPGVGIEPAHVTVTVKPR